MGTGEIPLSNAPGDNGGVPDKSSRKRKRNSDVRKEQNRVASRTYRQKRKEKLDLLNELLTTTPESAANISSSEQASGTPLSVPVPAHTAVPISTVDSSKCNLSSHTSNFGGLFLDGAWPAGEQTQALHDQLGSETKQQDTLVTNPAGADPFNAFIFEPPIGQGLDTPLPTTHSTSGAHQPAFTPISSIFFPFSQPSQPFAMPDIPSNVSDVGISASRRVATPLPTIQDLDIVPEPIRQAFDSFSRLTPSQQRQLIKTVTKKLPGSESTGDSESQHRRWWPEKSSAMEKQRWLDKLNRIASTTAPDPTAQSVQLRQASFFSAILENGIAIGLSRKNMLMESDSLSPFDFVPSGNQAAVALVQAKFSSVSADLRPTNSQITVAHHPYLDVIPFKTFREKASAALASDPPLFDEEGMCDDMCSSGLVCWGGQGSSGRGSGGMGAGVPWDSRSWEPQPWFLKKYWFLVGDWDDEMWTAARWWHAMRNEPLDAGRGE